MNKRRVQRPVAATAAELSAKVPLAACIPMMNTFHRNASQAIRRLTFPSAANQYAAAIARYAHLCTRQNGRVEMRGFQR